MKIKSMYSRGQMAVVMTLVIAVLLGACALGADVGVLYYNSVKLQKAADAAVLAGANYLTGASDTDTDLVKTTVQQYAESNGVLSSEVPTSAVTVDPNWEWVSVTISRDVPYYFARLLGLSQGLVRVYAKAGINDTQAPQGVAPVGLQCPPGDASIANCNGLYSPYVPGTKPMGLFQKFTNGGDVPGNWNALSFPDGTGVSQFENDVTFGYTGTPPLQVGSTIKTQPGQGTANHFNDAFAQRLANAGESYPPPNVVPPPNPSTADPQVILVPLVNFNDQGRTSYAIEGFAEMYVVPQSQCPGIGVNDICAFFLKQLPNNGVPTVNACSKVDAGQVVNQNGTVKINSCTPLLLD